MKERLRGLTPFVTGLVLIGASVLGLRLFRMGGPPGMSIVQPPASFLRAEGMRSARLFPGLKVLAVYTYRAPNYKRVYGGVSGIASQVLAILGTRRGAVLAVKEYAGPPFNSTQTVSVQGWFTALPPVVHPVRPAKLASLAPAASLAATDWLKSSGLRNARITVWPFPAETVVVATAHGQSEAILMAGGATPSLLGGSMPVLRGAATTVVQLKKKK